MTKWKVGITGGIGSGKSYCARIFNRLGIPVYYADIRANFIMHSIQEVIDRLTSLLGPEAYDEFGLLNKVYFRQQVFGAPEIRKQINAIVHPAVERDYEEWHEEQKSLYTLKEAALLVESGSYSTLDHLIMVKSPHPIRMQRIMTRDGLKVADVERRMRSQLPEADKEAVADLLIDNSGCSSVLAQVMNIHKAMLN